MGFSLIYEGKLRRVFAPAVAVVSSLFAVLLAIMPASEHTSKFTFEPKVDRAQAILLAADSPKSIEITFDSFTNIPDGLLFSSSATKAPGSLLIYKNKQELKYSVVDKFESSFQVRPGSLAAHCRLGFVVKDSAASIKCPDVDISTESFVADIGANYPVVTQVYSPWAKVIIQTKIWKYEGPLLRDLIRYFLLSLFIAIAFFVIIDRAKAFPAKVRSVLFLVKRNIFSILALFLIYVVAWPEPDDGNVMATFRNYGELRGLTNYYSAAAAYQPTGHLIMDFAAALSSSSQNLLALRLPAFISSALCLLLIDIVLRRLLDGESRQNERISIISGHALFLLGTLAYGVTLRPEPFVNILIILGIANFVFSRDSANSLLRSTGLACLAILLHQSGVFAFSLVVLEVIRGSFRATVISVWKNKKTQLALLFSLVSLTAFWQVSAPQLLEQVTFFTQNYSGYAQPFSSEINRYVWALTDVPPRATYAAVILLVLIFSSVLGFKPNGGSDTLKNIFALPIIGFSLLFLTSSKWPWHMGATVGIVSLGGALVVSKFRGFETQRFWILFTPWALFVLSNLATTSTHGYVVDNHPVSSMPLSYLYNALHQFSPDSKYFFIALTAFAILFFALWGSLGRLKSLSPRAPLFIAVITYVVCATVVPLSAQAFSIKPTFSYAGMNTASLWGGGCGLLDITSGSVVKETSGNFVNFKGAEESRIYASSSITGKTVGFTSISIAPKVNAEMKISKGSIGSNSAIYMRGHSSELLDVLTSGGAHETIELEKDVWVPFKLDSKSFAFLHRGDTGLVVDVSEIVELRNISPFNLGRKVLAGYTVVDPVYYPTTPCLTPPQINKGVFSTASFMVGDPSITDLGQLEELDVGLKYRNQFTTTKVGCPARVIGANDEWLKHQCLYWLSAESKPVETNDIPNKVNGKTRGKNE